MANYAVNDWASDIGSMETVLAELETKLETIDANKTIRLITVQPVGNSNFQSGLIYDA
jgi:tRNA A37 methylthiotransferase MiaB